MSAQPQRRFRFATPTQWSTCLFDRVDRDAFDAQGNIQPLAPYEQTARLYATDRAHAPAVTPAGEILWHDDAGRLHRLTACDDEPEVGAAPFAIAHASRLVSQWSGLWVISPERTSLERYEEGTLSRLSIIDLPDGAQVIDIASDGRDRLFVLVRRVDATQALRIDCAGNIVETVIFEGIVAATAFVYLHTPQRFVVMTTDECPQLYWFAASGGAALRSVVIGAMHPCFGATALGSNNRNRVFLGGMDGEELGGRPFVLVFDGDGQPLDEIALDVRDALATGVAGTRDTLLVTGPRGLLRYATAKTVPDGTAAVRCMLITPVMHSLGREESRRWLRIEAGLDLPDGASLEISYASTADIVLRNRLTAIAGNAASPASLRIQRLLREPGIWAPSVVFHGSTATAPESTSLQPRSAPLFDVQDPFVWVCITLSATAGGSLPSLDELAVLYPGTSLMENLPAIYRRVEAQLGSFLRSLVGVLESTTQGLDARIGSLAKQIDPATAKGPWVDFIARWLGVPWDDALGYEQKKLIISRAGDLARTRGTREGLETLLDCLLPGSPPRYRITDATADIGFAIVGGGACRGSALPVLLGGRTPWSPELGANAVLGHMRLPCAGQVDDGVRQLSGFVRIDLAATSEERQAWEPWLPALIKEVVPITARLQLQWVGPLVLRGHRLDGSLVLQGPPTPHLGNDAVTGVARLPERGSHITSTGADIGTRLQ
jgi:phage tail-like protein